MSILTNNSILQKNIEFISDYIIQNRLTTGDKLPSEGEFAEMTGASRAILRESMRHFRTLGIVQSKTKVGPVVGQLTPENPYQGHLPFIATQNNALQELAEFRIGIETGFAELIVKQARLETVNHLLQLCDDIDKAENGDECIRLDLEFHKTLLRIPNNSLLNGLVPLIVTFFQTFRQTSKQNPATTKIPVQKKGYNLLHRKMIECIKEQNPQGLIDCFREHIAIYIPLNQRE